MAKAIGIDLGTTNSVGCVVQNGQPRVLLSPHHEELTPSVVLCEKLDDVEEESLLVGRPALNQAKLFPRDTIYSVKRLIGRPFAHENVQKLLKLVTYGIVESTAPVTGLAAVTMGGKEYLPEDISALVLADIRKYCERAIGEEVTHAVITVPAYFGEPERAATREAGRKAGLVVKRLLPEPTAAALAFGAEATSPEGSFVLVYDLGGGTFDISIISVVGQDYNVMEVYGDQFLGGDDFDQVIVELMEAHVRDKYDGLDLAEDFRFRWAAKREAEEAKKRLSDAPATTILLPQAASVAGQDINIKLRIARSEFEERIAPLVAHTMALTAEALQHQSLTTDDITDVLLVGGSTAVPLVYESVARMFGDAKVRRSVNPMHCVAIGAAILADRMKGIECPDCQTLCDESLEKCPSCGASLAVARSVVQGMEITEITTNHFGIQAVSGEDPNRFIVLAQKGTEIPMREPATATLYTTEDGQDVIRVPVYEGLGASVLQNSRIGIIEYPLPASLPKNHPVRISLRLDRQSIVIVTIEVEGFGFSHEQTLKRNLVDEEAEETSSILEDDEEEIDEAEKMLGILDTFVERARQFRASYDALLTAAQKNRLDRAIKGAQAVVDEDQGDKAKQEIINLQQLMIRCGTATILDQAQIAASATDEQTAARIQEAAAQLQRAAEEHREAEVQRLSDPLARLIRQVFSRARDIEQIDAAKGWGHLLRDKRDAQS